MVGVLSRILGTGLGSQTTKLAQVPGVDRHELWKQGIKNIESGSPQGNYRALGKVLKDGSRAIGAYQIMDFNVGPWTKEVLGKAMTPREFLLDDPAQDAVFLNKFGKYVEQYGERGAAQAWFGGPGSVGKSGRKDVHGTTVGGYGDRFVKFLESGGVSLQEGPTSRKQAVAGGLGITTDRPEPNLMERILGLQSADTGEQGGAGGYRGGGGGGGPRVSMGSSESVGGGVQDDSAEFLQPQLSRLAQQRASRKQRSEQRKEGLKQKMKGRADARRS